MVSSLTTCLLWALVCPVFWEEAPKFDVNLNGNNWVLSLLLKEVKNAPAVERKLTNCVGHTVL